MKTFEQWQADNHTISEFLRIGDAIDTEFVNYFIEVLPPACMSERCIQLGEPSKHDPKTGKPMFETLQREGCRWIYKGVMRTPAGEKRLYIE